MIRTVGVVVPAANEQVRIGDCLAALSLARAALLDTRRPARAATMDRLDVRIIVVLDSCVDGTAAVVDRYPGVQALHCGVGRVGAARALGVRRLLGDCSTPPGQLWLANTDADSRVPADWISRMLSYAEAGTHLVLGTVTPDDDLDAGQRRAWLGRHRLRTGHPHVHGANFGIRADTYLALGGWPELGTGEDVALANRATATAGLRIVRTAAIPVTTSSRLVGRAPQGFASYLSALAAHP